MLGLICMLNGFECGFRVGNYVRLGGSFLLGWIEEGSIGVEHLRYQSAHTTCDLETISNNS